jgi:mandelate racemase
MSTTVSPVTTATIRELRARAVRVPMPDPHRTASGVIAESPLVLVDVVTSDGVTGHGIVFTYATAALAATTSFVRELAPLVVGSPLAPADRWQVLNARFRLLGTQGLVGMAISGIDMALWDALARTQGTSLVRLLGGVEKPQRCYGAVGYDGAAGAAKTAEAWARRGFTGVKAKIGYPDVQEDLAVIRAIRDAVGPAVAIMVDYNQSLTPTDAIGRIRVLEGEGLGWVEEPTLAHDFEGHAQIARAVATPIQCGENWWGPQDMAHAIRAGASDVVMPDVMKMLGITGWLKAATLAEAAGLRVSTHLWSEVSAQVLSLTPMAHWLEYCDWWNPILAEPLRVEQGLSRIEGVLGTGVAWNESAVERCLA